MKYKKLYVARSSEGYIVGVYTELQKIVDAYESKNLNVLELEQLDFSESQEHEVSWGLFITLVEVNPIFE